MNHEDIANEWLLLRNQGILHLIEKRAAIELDTDVLSNAFTCDSRTFLLINDRLLQVSDGGFWKEVLFVDMPEPGDSLTILCLEVAYGSRLCNMGVYEPKRSSFH